MMKNHNAETHHLISYKFRLQKLENAIEDSGGVKSCPAKMLIELLELRGEISILEKRLSKASSGPSHTQIHSIPAPIPFIDRPQERQLIEGPLKSNEKWVNKIVIQGMGGTGKTVLAMEAARAAEGLFKKVIWASANAAPITFEDLLTIILRSLNHPADPLTLNQKQSKASELLQKDPYLLVIDSFERIGDKQVDKFLAEHVFYPSKVLITTRHIWPQASSVIALEGLTKSQTKKMLKQIGERQGVKSNFTDNEIEKIYNITRGLPLALNLIIGLLYKDIPLESALKNLRSPGSTVKMYKNLFGNNWKILSKPGRRILMSMTFFAAPASEEALQVISDTRKDNYQSVIDALINMSLIQPRRDLLGGEKFRFSVHPLTRSFAMGKINNDYTLKNEIYNNAVSFFIELMEQLGRPGLQTEKYAQLEQDLPNCLATFEWCRNQHDNSNVYKIVEYLTHFLFERGFWNTRIQICDSASKLEKDSPKKDQEAAWRVAFWAGWVCARQNNYEEAKDWLEEAEESLLKISKKNKFRLFFQAKNSQLRALIAHGEGVKAYNKYLEGSGKRTDIDEGFDNANQFHDKARSLLKEYIAYGGNKWTSEDPDYAIAIIDSNQGDLKVDMGHWKNALDQKNESRQCFEKARKLYSTVLEKAKNSHWENKAALIASNAANLGHVEIWLEEKPSEEIRHRFDEALITAETIGRIHTIAWCYRGYGLVAQRMALKESSIPRKEPKLKEAHEWLTKALDIFERIGRQIRVAETEQSLKEVEAELQKIQA